MQIIETIFSFINYSASGVSDINFQQDENRLTFIVTDIAADGFTITYYLRAPSSEGVYSFSGTYQALGQQIQQIGGDSTIDISTGETVPDNIDDNLEKIVSKYNPDFNWKTQTPTRQDTLNAVINVVVQYFSTQNQTTKQEILNDVIQLVTLYFSLPT